MADMEPQPNPAKDQDPALAYHLRPDSELGGDNAVVAINKIITLLKKSDVSTNEVDQSLILFRRAKELFEKAIQNGEIKDEKGAKQFLVTLEFKIFEKKNELEKKTSSTADPLPFEPIEEEKISLDENFTKQVKALTEKLKNAPHSIIFQDVLNFLPHLKVAEELEDKLLAIEATGKSVPELSDIGDQIFRAGQLLKKIFARQFSEISQRVKTRSHSADDKNYLEKIHDHILQDDSLDFDTVDKEIIDLIYNMANLSVLEVVKKGLRDSASEFLTNQIKNLRDLESGFSESEFEKQLPILDSTTDKLKKTIDGITFQLQELTLKNEISDAEEADIRRLISATNDLLTEAAQRRERVVNKYIDEKLRRFKRMIGDARTDAEIKALESAVPAIFADIKLSPTESAYIKAKSDIKLALENTKNSLPEDTAEMKPVTPLSGAPTKDIHDKFRKLIAVIQSLHEEYEDSDRAKYISLYQELETTKDEIVNLSESPAGVDQSFPSALNKIHQFYEIVKIYQMNWEQLAKEVIRLNLKTNAIFSEFDATTAQKVKDSRTALINRFQSMYFEEKKEDMLNGLRNAEVEDFLPTGTDTRGMSRKQVLEMARKNYYFWRSYTWITRYNGDHPLKTNIPGASQHDLFVSIASLNNIDFLIEGVTKHDKYGKTVCDMLDYAVLFMAKRVPSRDPKTLGLYSDDKTQGVNGKWLDYNGVNRQNGIEDFRKHLEAVFLGAGPGKLPDQFFDIAWNLYKGFDLPSISLSLLQRETMTRSHNVNKRYSYIDDSSPNPQTLDFDLDFNDFIFHGVEHKNGRYGKGKHAGNILYMFTGKPPTSKWVNSAEWVEDEHGHRKRIITNEERQQLLNKYYQMFFSIEGIGNKLFPDGSSVKDWDTAVFPDILTFIKGEAGTTDIGAYTVALQGWNNMLELIMSPIEPFDDIEKVINDKTGLLFKMTEKGIGLAKLADGPHRKLFVPMLRLYIGRLGMAYTSAKASDRMELQEEIVKSLDNAKRLGLKINDASFKRELDELIHELEHGSKELGYKNGWKRNLMVMIPGFPMRGVSDILLPRNTLKGLFREERVAFAKQWWEVVTRNDNSGKAATRPKYLPRWMFGVGPGINYVLSNVYPALYSDKLKLKVKLYDKIIHGTFNAHELQEIENMFINKEDRDTDTSAKGGKH